MKVAANPGWSRSSGTAAFHFRATIDATAWPRSATWAAGSSNCAIGSVPKRRCKASQPAMTPGTVTVSQPRRGRPRRKYSGDHAAGEWPDAFSPWSAAPSQISAKASPPRPHDTGSTTVSAAAAAMAASTALPPFHSILSPICAASGCDVDTTFRANTGWRVVEYGLFQLNEVTCNESRAA